MQDIFIICDSGKLKLERYTKLKNISCLLNIINVTELRWMNCLEHVACILEDEILLQKLEGIESVVRIRRKFETDMKWTSQK
jgi:hypothetical protein